MRGVGLSDPVESAAAARGLGRRRRGRDCPPSGRSAPRWSGTVTRPSCCMLFAAMHPDQTSALVTMNGYARLRRAPDYPWGFPAAARLPAIEVIEGRVGHRNPARHRSIPASAEGPRGCRVVGEAGASRGEPAACCAQATTRLRRRRAGRAPVDLGTDARSPLRRANGFVLDGHAHHLVDNIPGSRLLELPGRDHAAHVQDPRITHGRDRGVPDRCQAALQPRIASS